MCILISVFCSESVLRWFAELLRVGFGRVEEDMLRGMVCHSRSCLCEICR